MPRRATNTSPAAAPTSAMGIVPLDLLDAIVIEEVSDALWKRVFDVIGYPAGLSSRNVSAKVLVDHIAKDGASDDLVEVLRVIHELGTDDGIDAMKAVADAHNTDLGAITARAPRDAAVELWLAQRAKPALRDLFTRVQMQAESRRSPRSFREFRGKRAQKLAAWATIHPRLVTAVRAWCTAQHFGDHVDVRGYIENGGAQIQIIHGHRLQKPVVVKDGGHGRRTLELRPAHCDIVRYDWKGSWLRLSPKSTGGGIVETYRRLLGEVFFDDAEFFTEADYSLRPLQEYGQAILDGAPSIARARVTDLVWDHGGEIIRIRSSDCLASVARMGIPPTEGDFIEARIAVVLPGRREVRRSLHVKVPNKVDYPRDEVHAVAIDDFLAATGIRMVDTRRRNLDLWDLHPWQHGERVWRAAYPDDVDRLAQAQVLRPVELATVAHPDRPRHGRVLRAEDGFGISLDEDVPPRVLTSTDVSGLALDGGALLASWRAALGLDGDTHDLGDGAHVLGERGFDSVQCAVVALLRQPNFDAANLGKRIRSAVTPGAVVALLAPPGRASDTGFPTVALEGLVLEERAFWRRFMIAAAVGTRVPAIWRAPDARLVVDKGRMCVWLDGVPIDVAPDSAAYRFIAALADAHGNPVTNETLDGLLSANREEGFARKVKLTAKKAIEASLAKAGHPVDGDSVLVTVRGQGYRLGVSSHVG